MGYVLASWVFVSLIFVLALCKAAARRPVASSLEISQAMTSTGSSGAVEDVKVPEYSEAKRPELVLS